ncbi:hypothetical protein [Staphylococcus equorum]
MKKLVVYGSFSSMNEVDEIVTHCRDEYKNYYSLSYKIYDTS